MPSLLVWFPPYRAHKLGAPSEECVPSREWKQCVCDTTTHIRFNRIVINVEARGSAAQRCRRRRVSWPSTHIVPSGDNCRIRMTYMVDRDVWPRAESESSSSLRSVSQVLLCGACYLLYQRRRLPIVDETTADWRETTAG